MKLRLLSPELAPIILSLILVNSSLFRSQNKLFQMELPLPGEWNRKGCWER